MGAALADGDDREHEKPSMQRSILHYWKITTFVGTTYLIEYYFRNGEVKTMDEIGEITEHVGKKRVMALTSSGVVLR